MAESTGSTSDEVSARYANVRAEITSVASVRLRWRAKRIVRRPDWWRDQLTLATVRALREELQHRGDAIAVTLHTPSGPT